MAFRQYRAAASKKRAARPKASSLGSIFGRLAKAATRASRVDGDQVVRLVDRHLPSEVREQFVSRSEALVAELEAIAEQHEADAPVLNGKELAAALKAAPSVDDQLKSMLLAAAQWAQSRPQHQQIVVNLSLTFGVRIDGLEQAKLAVAQARTALDGVNSYGNAVYAELGRRIETLYILSGRTATFREIAAQIGIGLRTAHRSKTWYQLARCLPALLVAPEVRHTICVNHVEKFRKAVAWLRNEHPGAFEALRSSLDVKFVSAEAAVPNIEPAPITNVLKLEGVDDGRLFGFGAGELTVFGKSESDDMPSDIPAEAVDDALRTAFGPIDALDEAGRQELLEQVAPATPSQPYDNSAMETDGEADTAAAAVPYAVGSGNPKIPITGGLPSYTDVSDFSSDFASAYATASTAQQIQVILVAGGSRRGPFTVLFEKVIANNADSVILSYVELALTELPGYEANEELVWAVGSLANESAQWNVFTEDRTPVTSADPIVNNGNYYLCYTAKGAAEAIDLLNGHHPSIGPTQAERSQRQLQQEVAELRRLLEAVLTKVDAKPVPADAEPPRRKLQRPRGAPRKGYRWDDYRGYVPVEVEGEAAAVAPV